MFSVEELLNAGILAAGLGDDVNAGIIPAGDDALVQQVIQLLSDLLVDEGQTLLDLFSMVFPDVRDGAMR